MAKAKKWCCTTCGSPYTRSASCKRHIFLKHGGVGLAVPETEYIIGRQSGTFAAPIYVPGSARKPASEPKKERSIVDILMEEQLLEFWREVARITARNTFKPAATFAGGAYNQQPVSPFAVDKELFGMTAYICSNCYVMKQRNIYYNEGELGGSVQTIPPCVSGAPDFIAQLKSKDEYVASRSKEFPDFLKTCLDAWTNRKAIIVAVEIFDPARTSNNIIFVRARSTGEKISINLKYSEEKCVELDPKSTGAWAPRAIRERRTAVNDKELIEFLGKTKDSTFGFFKMKEAGVERIFLLLAARAEDKSTEDLSVPHDEVAVTIPTKQEKEQRPRDEAPKRTILESPSHTSNP